MRRGFAPIAMAAFAAALAVLAEGALSADGWDAELAAAVSACWSVGGIPEPAAVTVLVRFDRAGRPEEVVFVSTDATTAGATERVFDAARRAVIRCGARGFPLPAEEYDQWREIEMTFDPSNMRIR